MSDEPKKQDDTGELMYVKCAYCGKWMDVKPGNIAWVSHSLCEDCLAKELEKIKGMQKKKEEQSPPGNT